MVHTRVRDLTGGRLQRPLLRSPRGRGRRTDRPRRLGVRRGALFPLRRLEDLESGRLELAGNDLDLAQISPGRAVALSGSRVDPADRRRDGAVGSVTDRRQHRTFSGTRRTLQLDLARPAKDEDAHGGADDDLRHPSAATGAHLRLAQRRQPAEVAPGRVDADRPDAAPACATSRRRASTSVRGSRSRSCCGRSSGRGTSAGRREL